MLQGSENFQGRLDLDVIAVQDGIGAADNGKAHVTPRGSGNYLRAVKSACDEYGVEFWVDMEMWRRERPVRLRTRRAFTSDGYRLERGRGECQWV